jgi:hypothetical protein
MIRSVIPAQAGIQQLIELDARYAVPKLPRSLAARMREALGHTCTHCVQCGVTVEK